MISRHREGQESNESDPCQGKLQKDLDFVHIPMYAVLVVKPAYVHVYRFKSRVYHFSCVFRDDQGKIKGQKMVHGVYGVCSGIGEGHTNCDSPSVVKSDITTSPSLRPAKRMRRTPIHNWENSPMNMDKQQC